MAHMLDGGEQHTAGAAGGIVDGLALLGVEDLDHEPHDAARGIKLAGLFVGGVGKGLDQIFVGIADDVVAHNAVAEQERREMLDEILEQIVGEAFLVGPLGIAEDAVKMILIGPLDAAHGVGDGCADVCGGLADVVPMATLGDLEAVLIGEVFAVGRDHLGVLLVPDIAEPFKEQQREDVALPVGAIDRAPAQDIGGFPKMRFELGKGNARGRQCRVVLHDCWPPTIASPRR